MSCGPLPPALIVVYVSITASTFNFDIAFDAWFNTLPTTLPYKPNVLWNNAGVLAKS